MRLLNRLHILIGSAALLGAAGLVYADPAPVYDVDDLDQGGYVHNDDDLPPPPDGLSDAGLMPATDHHESSHHGTIATASMSMAQRLKQMEVQLNSLLQSGSAAHIDSLQTQIQVLRNQVEQMSKQLEQLKSEQKASYTELDDRVAKLQGGGSLPQPKPARKVVAKKTEKPKADSQPDVAEEQQIYQTAYTLIKEKKYDDAISALQTMLKKYPRGQFASNAHYWLGELYGLLGSHDQSLAEFVTVVSNYPKSPRVSDAQLKVGLIFASQSKWTQAKSAFKKVVNRYPGTASARLASEQLKELKKSGH